MTWMSIHNSDFREPYDNVKLVTFFQALEIVSKMTF